MLKTLLLFIIIVAEVSNKLWSHLDEIDKIRFTSELDIVKQLNDEKQRRHDEILDRREAAKLLCIIIH